MQGSRFYSRTAIFGGSSRASFSCRRFPTRFIGTDRCEFRGHSRLVNNNVALLRGRTVIADRRGHRSIFLKALDGPKGRLTDNAEGIRRAASIRTALKSRYIESTGVVRAPMVGFKLVADAASAASRVRSWRYG
jgi:hypothetical protein